jgi:hypothetical protein
MPARSRRRAGSGYMYGFEFSAATTINLQQTRQRSCCRTIQTAPWPRFLISPRVASTSLGEVSKLGDKRA